MFILGQKVMSTFLEIKGSPDSMSLTRNMSFKLIWDDQHRKQLMIPQITNDYNHWMLGVDVVDQLIAYYRPKIWCRHTWVPIFLHCLDILRVILYVLYTETAYNHVDVDKDKVRNHKHFSIEFVNSLIR